jgi:hypothetical protein
MSAPLVLPLAPNVPSFLPNCTAPISINPINSVLPLSSSDHSPPCPFNPDQPSLDSSSCPSSVVPSSSVPTPPVPPPPVPPDPLPSWPTPLPPPAQTAVPSLPSQGEQTWSSLFKHKPKNAGKYVPVELFPQYEDNMLVPPKEVLEAGAKIWNDTLVGFFLDKPLSYTAVIQNLKIIWKLKGSVKVKSDGIIFLFNFTCDEDRCKILQSDPVIIKNKMFIIKPYDAAVSNITGSVTAVPVWVHLYNLPLFAWSPLGINWLSSHLGKLLCMDEMTEKQNRLSYAKCLIEVKPNKELPDEFLVKLVEGGFQKIYVQYQWRPDVCVLCKMFGHATECCDVKDKSEIDKVIEIKKNGRKVNKEDTEVNGRGNEKFKPLQKQNAKSWQQVNKKKIDKIIKETEKELSRGDNEIEVNEMEIKKVDDEHKNEKSDEIEQEIEQGEIIKDNGECNNGSADNCHSPSVDLDNEIIKKKTEKSVFEELVDDILISNKFDALLELNDTEIMREVQEENVMVNGKNGEELRNYEGKTTSETRKKIKQGEQSDRSLKQVKLPNTMQKQQQDQNSGDKTANNYGNKEGGAEIDKEIEESSSMTSLKSEKSNSKKIRHTDVINTNMHNVQKTCTTDLTYQPDIVPPHNHTQPHFYSNIKPPMAYKPPPISPTHSSPHILQSTSTFPARSDQSSSPKNGTRNSEVTPLSATIPNYLTSKHAVTRRMKIEMLNARVL